MYNTDLKTSVCHKSCHRHSVENLPVAHFFCVYSTAHRRRGISCRFMLSPIHLLLTLSPLQGSTQQQKALKWPVKALSFNPAPDLTEAFMEGPFPVTWSEAGPLCRHSVLSTALNRGTQTNTGGAARTCNIRHGRLAENRALKSNYSLLCQEGVNPAKTEH